MGPKAEVQRCHPPFSMWRRPCALQGPGARGTGSASRGGLLPPNHSWSPWDPTHVDIFCRSPT